MSEHPTHEVEVRAQRADELGAVLALVADAFVEEPEVVGLVRDLEADPGFEPALSIVAERDGALVGHVLLTPAELEGEQGAAPARLLSLAPLGVAAAHQGRGVGSRLVKAALRAAAQREVAAVVVLGDPAYYARFGFVPALPLGILPPHPVAMEEAWMIIETVPGALAGHAGTVRFLAPLADPKYW